MTQKHYEPELTPIFAFVNQAVPDIRKKLQKLHRLGEPGIRELMMVAERVSNTRQSTEEKEIKKEKRKEKALPGF